MALSLLACGKKGPPSPIPKAGAAPAIAVGGLRGEVRDGVLFLSFIMPESNLGSFAVRKSCTGCGGTLEPWKEIHLTDREGYTIYNGRLYFYDDDLREGVDYAYQVTPFTEKGVPGAPSNVYSIKWERTPAPPKQVKATADDRRADLSWSEVPGVTYYNVYRSEDDVYPLEPLNMILLTTTSFTDLTPKNGKRYKYEVRSVRLAGQMRWEGEGTGVDVLVQDRTAPGPPRNAMAEKKDNGVTISWEKNAEPDLLGYNIYRSSVGNPEKLNKEPLKVISYFDIPPGNLRYVSYYVTAVDTSGNESGPSREIVVTLKE